MIITKTIEVRLAPANMKHFESLGYELPKTKDSRGRIRVKRGETIIVKIEDLPPKCEKKIKYECDECHKIFETNYNSIFGRENSQFLKTGKNLCVKCSNKILNSGEKNHGYKHGCYKFCEYRSGARNRGIDFHLTPEEVKEMIKLPCHYCGGFSANKRRHKKQTEKLNGIDRKDSSVGYTKENCVPCCSVCNYLKNNLSYDDFLDFIKRIYKRIFENEI